MFRSRVYLSLVLFTTSLFTALAGNTDKGKVKISVSSRDDGTLSASFYITNATSDILQNWNLQLNLNTQSDGPSRRLGVRGFIKDMETNEIADVSSLKSHLAAEEDTKSINFPDKEDRLKIVSRSEWNATQELIREKRSKAAEFLIVDGHSYKMTGGNYYTRMQSLELYQSKEVGDLYCNFYIADDGYVFEGLGWKNVNYIRNGGLGPRSLIIGLIKKEQDDSPSSAAIKTYKDFVETAIQNKILSPDYTLIPYHLIYEFLPLSKNSFEKNEMRYWDRYTDNLDFLLPLDTEGDGVFPIVCREEWNGMEPMGNMMTIVSPIEYVVVKHYGARCFSYHTCKEYLKVEERYSRGKDEDVYVNFFIAEDGRAYEVIGWDKTWYEPYRQKKAILVTFLGRFYSYRPHGRAMIALQRLIKLGVWLGKISPQYRIVSVTSIYRSEAYIGERLTEEIRKMYQYTDKFWM